MGGPVRDRVLAASEAWTWLPALAPRAETDELLVVRYPPWWAHPLQLVRFRPQRPAGAVLDDAVASARALTAGIEPELLCWVRLDAPDGFEAELVARGAHVVETVDVLARDLTDHDAARLAPSREVELAWSEEVQVLLDAADLSTRVFGGTAVDREALLAEHPGEVHKLRTGGGGAVVAYLDDRPVGSAGLTVEGRDARLWGGAVLPEARGGGVYRALLAARLDYASAVGADLAIVKGRVETSGPILRRAGFEAYGQERSYVVRLDGNPTAG